MIFEGKQGLFSLSEDLVIVHIGNIRNLPRSVYRPRLVSELLLSVEPLPPLYGDYRSTVFPRFKWFTVES